VMGGFSHSRWREQVFGGVTRTVLEGTRTPVLFSH
jgi:nucleotide-binding universal stress UspA family protein